MLRSILLLGSLPFFLSACSSSGPAPSQLRLRSESGLVSVDISFVGSVSRGENELVVRLDAPDDDRAARLIAVDATMAAHAHVAHARRIDGSDGDFRVQSLDLFMTGRWQVEMTLALADTQDSLSFPVDVP